MSINVDQLIVIETSSFHLDTVFTTVFDKYGNLSDDLGEGFIDHAPKLMLDLLNLKKKNLEIVEDDYKRSFEIISARVRAGIGRNIFGDEAFFPILHEIDTVLRESVSAQLN